MKNTIKNKITQIFTLLVLLVIMFSTFLGAFNTPQITYADTTTDLALDKTNVLEDLQDSTIDGVPFNLTDYAFTESEDTQVLLFTEYCYSFYSNLQYNYSLYVYVWNPKGIKFDVDSKLNTINLRAGSNVSNPYNKYSLIFLNQSVKENVQGLFLKFKVDFTAEDKEYIFGNLNSLERVYRVAEIELLTSGEINASTITVATTYTYSGFAAGFGSDSAAENTLSCKQEQADTLELEVFHTQYRSGISNGKDLYTEDSLHSVYFAVPNEFIKTFGELTAVHAQWLNAVLNPALVIDDETIFNAFNEYVGQDIGKFNSNLLYSFLTNCQSQVSGNSNIDFYNGDIGYNSPTAGYESDLLMADKWINILYFLFDTCDDGETWQDAEDYTVCSEVIKERLLYLTDSYGGELVNGKYSKVLFESVDAEYTDMNVESDYEFKLATATITKNFWEKLFGLSGTVISSVEYDGLQAIIPITDSDITNNAEKDCKKLYISTSDYEEFCNQYNKAKAEDKTLFLFRYQISDYTATPTSVFKLKERVLGGYDVSKLNVGAYLFQQTVNLDFDIIDVTFSNGEIDTVIGVASSPIDVIPDATPPINYDNDSLSWWQVIIAVIMVVLLLIILQLTGILPVVLKVIGFIILLPFRIIEWLIKSIGKLFNKKE